MVDDAGQVGSIGGIETASNTILGETLHPEGNTENVVTLANESLCDVRG